MAGKQPAKHVVVREHLRELVSNAEPGDPAPSERELVQRFGVARMTVRHAIDSLVEQGLLERIPGRGTFVAKPHLDLQARLSSFTEEMRRRGKQAGSQTLLCREEAAGPGVARALETHEGARIAHWRRLRLADGEPVCVTDAYLSLDTFPEFLEEDLPDSLYVRMRTLGLMPSWGEDSANAGSASEEEAEHLQVRPGSPVLRVSRRAFCAATACEVTRSAFRADRFTLWIPVLRAEHER